MNSIIVTIPADREGNKLFITHYHKMNNRMFCSYKSTYNDIPWQETELFFANDNTNVTILAPNGVVLWRFSVLFLNKFNKD